MGLDAVFAKPVGGSFNIGVVLDKQSIGARAKYSHRFDENWAAFAEAKGWRTWAGQYDGQITIGAGGRF